jgi:hypothetical protein
LPTNQRRLFWIGSRAGSRAIFKQCAVKPKLESWKERGKCSNS